MGRPRISVFRSNRYVWVQLIDDTGGRTLAQASEREVAKRGRSARASKESRLARAERVGTLLAERALRLKISKAVFDRGGYQYHGIVKAVAEGARKAGLLC